MSKRSKPAKKSPAKKSAATTRTPKSTAAAAPDDSTVALSLVLNLSRHLAPNTDAERRAFESRITDDEAERVGARTQSAAVERCAATWAKTMQPYVARGLYGVARYRYFLDKTAELSHLRTERAATTGQAAMGRATLVSTEESARTAREELLHKLQDVAGKHATDVAEVAVARGDSRSADDLASSLRAAANLARKWLADTSDERRALVEAAGLSAGDADEAVRLANALRGAAGDDRGSRVDVRDTPAINVCEGRLLFEMDVAMGVFARAAKKDKRVPKLEPTPPLRHVLGRKHAALADAPATAADPGVAASGAGTTSPGAAGTPPDAKKTA